MNSIKINKGNRPNRLPFDIKKKKNTKSYFFYFKIIAPNTIVKLKKNIKIK